MQAAQIVIAPAADWLKTDEQKFGKAACGLYQRTIAIST
jgi:hypothetical protein